MFSLDLFASTAVTAAQMLGEECAVVEEHVLQKGLQEVDRSLAVFDDISPTSPGIPGYERPPQLPSKPRPHHMLFRPGGAAGEGGRVVPVGHRRGGEDGRRAGKESCGREKGSVGATSFAWPDRSPHHEAGCVSHQRARGPAGEVQAASSGEQGHPTVLAPIGQHARFARDLTCGGGRSLSRVPQGGKQLVLPSRATSTLSDHAQSHKSSLTEDGTNCVGIRQQNEIDVARESSSVFCDARGTQSVVSAAEESVLPSDREDLSSGCPIPSSDLKLTSSRKPGDASPAQGTPAPTPSSTPSVYIVSASPSSLSSSPHGNSILGSRSRAGTIASRDGVVSSRARSSTSVSRAALHTRTVQFQFNTVTHKVAEDADSTDDDLTEVVRQTTEISANHDSGVGLPPPPSPPPSRSASRSGSGQTTLSTEPSSSQSPVTSSGVSSTAEESLPKQTHTDAVETYSSLQPELWPSASRDDVVGDVESDAESEGEEDAEGVHDLKQYAEQFFNQHERDSGGWGRRRRHGDPSSDYLSHEEMLRYCKTGLMPTSLTRLPTPHLTRVAVTMFKDVTRVIRGEVKEEVMLGTVRHVVGRALEHVEVRDEVLCQLVRQTSHNPEPDSLRQAWLLLTLCTACFSPSKHLHKHVLRHVRRSVGDPVVGGHAVMCHSHLTTPRQFSRRFPPSAVEIMNLQQQTGTLVKVYLLDGKTKAVSVMPRDTTLLVLHKVATRVGLQSVDGWALYEGILKGFLISFWRWGKK
ncbi:uncharacterized protein LOC143281457 [Babylonia areolata]|uniref:uncharacterized protein LOC143281457 n=1 Tax=Babylonia areolata TaxID=304850 RepID=UPI003FCF31C0